MNIRLRTIALVMTAITIGLMILSCGKKTEEPPVLETKSASNADRGRLEVNFTFNIPKGTTRQTYQLWMNDIITKIGNTEGCASCFVSHNVVDHPEVKITIWWQSLAAWTEFTTSPTWNDILAKMNSVYANDINAEFWMFRMVRKTKQTEEPPVPDTKMAMLKGPIEVNFSINLAPGVGKEEYNAWVQSVITASADASGNMLSFASHNVWDSPLTQWTSWWIKLDHWTAFVESHRWQDLLDRLHSKYANDITIEIWQLDKVQTPPKYEVLKKKKPEEPPEPDTL